MLEINEIKGIKITPPKWWVVVIIAVVGYCLWNGDVDTIIGLLEVFK